MSQPSSSSATAVEIVQCETWPEFVERCASDLARGGMYLPTSTAHTVWTVITVRLVLPAGHQVDLQGRVVHVIDEEAAAKKHMPPGAGVEFIDLDGPRAGALSQLLEYARTEGRHETPRYTFAQWLSMSAVSQAPSDLMASLPPTGPTASTSTAPREARQSAQTHPQRRRTDAPSAGREATSSSAVRKREPSQPSQPSQPPRVSTPSRGPQVSRRPPENSAAAQLRRSIQPKQSKSRAPAPTAANRSQPPAASEPPLRDIPTQPKNEDLHATGDNIQLKLGMTHLAHRRYAEATAVFDEMIANDVHDRDAWLWRHMSEARAAAANRKAEAAVAHYRKVLVVDQHNREAKDKIKALQREAKLDAIPFGRFFKK